MIKINCDIFNAAVALNALDHLAKYTLRLYVRGRQAFTILQISAFYLVCGNRAAPQKGFRESFHHVLLLLMAYV
ncbi:hypothetical protein D3C72_1706880 [compost metagenome]